MRFFVTGASGWIGSAVVAELITAGHQVLGLARSEQAATTIAGLGADVHRGGLDDAASLRTGADTTDGVIHLGYHHDFTDMAAAAATDLAAITTFGTALAGSDRPLLIASGLIGLPTGRIVTEQDAFAPGSHPRAANADAALALAAHGVRSSVVRFAPTVHGPGDHGFVAALVAIARDKGVSGYLGDGTNEWPAVHRLDAATLVRLAVLGAPAGSVLHAAAEQGVPTRRIAEAIGAGLGLPVAAIPAGQAGEHFGWMAAFFGAGGPASSTATRDLLGWKPVQQGLIADLRDGAYYRPGEPTSGH
jgi:nucleoside-diphosphate-sugar epimerase